MEIKPAPNSVCLRVIGEYTGDFYFLYIFTFFKFSTTDILLSYSGITFKMKQLYDYLIQFLLAYFAEFFKNSYFAFI